MSTTGDPGSGTPAQPDDDAASGGASAAANTTVMPLPDTDRQPVQGPTIPEAFYIDDIATIPLTQREIDQNGTLAAGDPGELEGAIRTALPTSTIVRCTE